MPVKSKKVPEQRATRLGALDLDLAPRAPGLYAWYAQIALSGNDWQERIASDGRDLSGNFLLDALHDYAGLHQEPSLKLRANASYDLTWSGSMRKESVSDNEAGGEESILSSHMQGIIAQPYERRLLLELLKSAPPIFASPLYIGVASNLRERLTQHKQNYESARIALRNQPGFASRLQFQGKDFGTRLAGAGIPLERLECWILEAPEFGTDGSSEISVTRRRIVLEAAEWLLHRIFQPVMGRR